MLEIERRKTVRDSLRAKLGSGELKKNEEGRIVLPNYGEAMATGNVTGMINAKINSFNSKRAVLKDEIKNMSIFAIRKNIQAVERKLNNIDEEYNKELQAIEEKYTQELEEDLRSVKNSLSRQIRDGEYMKKIEEEQEIIDNKYRDKLKLYLIERKELKLAEENYYEDNKELIEKAKREEKEKEIKELLKEERRRGLYSSYEEDNQ